MDKERFVLPREMWEQMVAHARREDPNEACGALAGKGSHAQRLYPLTNTERSPYRYMTDPKELYQAMKDAERSGLEIIAFYHSHTHTPAYPSPTDVRLATWPEAYYLIISLQDKASPVVRAFRIQDGRVREVPLDIVPPSQG
ncbi:MAG: M67 family metallopeptidase [Dehalococcoidia bacterium]|nr:M67 family metallopeptidase [Dehalococcoidia bacterium]MDW8119720.1 M67 family metallopeptidase [Chloroflexota bacterium]